MSFVALATVFPDSIFGMKPLFIHLVLLCFFAEHSVMAFVVRRSLISSIKRTNLVRSFYLKQLDGVTSPFRNRKDSYRVAPLQQITSNHAAAGTGAAGPGLGSPADSSRPLKVMVFMDGTWLFYSLILGRYGSCPVQRRWGQSWYRTHRIDWSRLQQLIARNIHSQILAQSYSDRAVEVVRTIVFTSTRTDTPLDGRRANMINEFNAANFEVHRLVTATMKEKCVDIR